MYVISCTKPYIDYFVSKLSIYTINPSLITKKVLQDYLDI